MTRPPPARLIIKYRDKSEHNDDASAIAHMESSFRARSDLKLRVLRRLSGRAHLVIASTRINSDRLNKLALELSQQDDIEFVERDARRFPTLIPLDPEFINQNYLSDSVTGINTPPAWDTTTGAKATVVALVDTGVLDEHVDLKGRILPGYDFISVDPDGSFFTANDGDGRDPDPSDPGDGVARDECGPGAPGSASTWHGTRVASLIGANMDNQNGMVGIDWETRILPVRAIGRCGGFSSDLADAIRWAAGLPVPGVHVNPTPANVINLSLGAQGRCLQTEQNAINDALATGALVVVAAGNNSKNALRTSPANCSGVLSVAATRFDGGLAGFSNFGVKVSLSAPGTGIVTASNLGLQEPLDSPEGDTYNNTSGTSFSTPLVSGVAALMLSLNDGLHRDQIIGTLRATTHGFPASTGFPCFDPLCGTGIVDAAQAVQAVTTGNLRSATDGGNGVLAAMREADPLPNGVLTTDALDTDFELDAYQVVLTKAGTLTVTSQGGTDTYGYLFDASGNLLEQDDDIEFPTNLNFSVSVALASGTYFIGVEGFNKNMRGDYQLQASYPSSNDSGNISGSGVGGDSGSGDGGGGGGGGGTFDAYLIILLFVPISGAFMRWRESSVTARPARSAR